MFAKIIVIRRFWKKLVSTIWPTKPALIPPVLPNMKHAKLKRKGAILFYQDGTFC
jgi:hypothetical protein